MNYKFLLYSFLFAIASLAYYKFNKWWVKVRKEKVEGFYKPDTYIGIIRNWIIIIGLVLASLVYLLESIGCM
jgi:hypothetical protein